MERTDDSKKRVWAGNPTQNISIWLCARELIGENTLHKAFAPLNTHAKINLATGSEQKRDKAEHIKKQKINEQENIPPVDWIVNSKQSIHSI
jgi:hypothetical protein